MTQIQQLYDVVVKGDRDGAVSLTREALAASVSPQSLIDEAMIPAMEEVGRRFENDEYFVPELLLSARAMKAALEWVNPLLRASGTAAKGRVILGTVQGDLHDIGKNLVSAMFEGAGFEVSDLGTDVSPEQFAEAVAEQEPDLLGLSALLTVTMPSMRATIKTLEKAGLRDRVKVLVGGAPLSDEYAAEIGADAYADNANSAVRAAQQLLAS